MLSLLIELLPALTLNSSNPPLTRAQELNLLLLPPSQRPPTFSPPSPPSSDNSSHPSLSPASPVQPPREFILAKSPEKLLAVRQPIQRGDQDSSASPVIEIPQPERIPITFEADSYAGILDVDKINGLEMDFEEELDVSFASTPLFNDGYIRNSQEAQEVSNRNDQLTPLRNGYPLVTSKEDLEGGRLAYGFNINLLPLSIDPPLENYLDLDPVLANRVANRVIKHMRKVNRDGIPSVELLTNILMKEAPSDFFVGDSDVIIPHARSFSDQRMLTGQVDTLVSAVYVLMIKMDFLELTAFIRTLSRDLKETLDGWREKNPGQSIPKGFLFQQGTRIQALKQIRNEWTEDVGRRVVVGFYTGWTGTNPESVLDHCRPFDHFKPFETGKKSHFRRNLFLARQALDGKPVQIIASFVTSHNSKLFDVIRSPSSTMLLEGIKHSQLALQFPYLSMNRGPAGVSNRKEFNDYILSIPNESDLTHPFNLPSPLSFAMIFVDSITHSGSLEEEKLTSIEAVAETFTVPKQLTKAEVENEKKKRARVVEDRKLVPRFREYLVQGSRIDPPNYTSPDQDRYVPMLHSRATAIPANFRALGAFATLTQKSNTTLARLVTTITGTPQELPYLCLIARASRRDDSNGKDSKLNIITRASLLAGVLLYYDFSVNGHRAIVYYDDGLSFARFLHSLTFYSSDGIKLDQPELAVIMRLDLATNTLNLFDQAGQLLNHSTKQINVFKKSSFNLNELFKSKRESSKNFRVMLWDMVKEPEEIF